MRKLIFVFLILGLGAVYYDSVQPPGESSAEPNKKSFIKSSVAGLVQVFKNSTAVAKSGAEVTKEDPQASPDDLSGFAANELRHWVKSEAGTMNSLTNDTPEIQVRLAAQARTLKAEQLQDLKSLALAMQEPVNDRIFSAYMLSLSPADGSQSQLFDVAQAAVPDYGPILAHSEAELKHSQELAIRYMEVDELFNRAKTDANARNNLKLLSTQAASDQVRNYADRKYKELK